MTWIRGPWWDGFFLLSGLPIGLVLVGAYLLGAPPILFLGFFIITVLLEAYHLFSPMVGVWTNREFRTNVILANPWKWIGLPCAIIVGTVLIGLATDRGWTSYIDEPGQAFVITDWTNPFPLVLWTFFLWNLYHFGMQNFGVVQLYKRATSLWGRRATKYGCLSVTVIGMALLSNMSMSVWFLCYGVFSFQHWTTAIALDGQLSSRPLVFVAIILLLGFVGLIYKIPTEEGILVRIIPIINCAWVGLSFCHFLYTRWIPYRKFLKSGGREPREAADNPNRLPQYA